MPPNRTSFLHLPAFPLYLVYVMTIGQCSNKCWLLINAKIQSVIYFGRGATVRDERFNTFSRQILCGQQSRPSVSEMGTEQQQILRGHTSVIDASQVCVRFQVHCLVSELECLKVQN